jgi:hypothetical protein
MGQHGLRESKRQKQKILDLPHDRLAMLILQSYGQTGKADGLGTGAESLAGSFSGSAEAGRDQR